MKMPADKQLICELAILQLLEMHRMLDHSEGHFYQNSIAGYGEQYRIRLVQMAEDVLGLDVAEDEEAEFHRRIRLARNGVVIPPHMIGKEPEEAEKSTHRLCHNCLNMRYEELLYDRGFCNDEAVKAEVSPRAVCYRWCGSESSS